MSEWTEDKAVRNRHWLQRTKAAYNCELCADKGRMSRRSDGGKWGQCGGDRGGHKRRAEVTVRRLQQVRNCVSEWF